MESRALIKPRPDWDGVKSCDKTPFYHETCGIKVIIDDIDLLNMGQIYTHKTFCERYLKHCCHNCPHWSKNLLVKP